MIQKVVAAAVRFRSLVLLATLMLIVSGLFAFKQLNIEAYPNPTPVILEITAQAPGLSAEEMERYYTIPMEIGLYPTPFFNLIGPAVDKLLIPLLTGAK